MTNNIVNSFSKLTIKEKQEFVAQLISQSDIDTNWLQGFISTNKQFAEAFTELSENTVSSYHLPYSIAPNVMVNGKVYHVPMVTEESSVVAAAAASAKFWSQHGGFTVESISTVKLGHVYFTWSGSSHEVTNNQKGITDTLIDLIKPTTQSMEKRGGGVLSASIESLPAVQPNLFRLSVRFETVDSMGANFINTCLEEMGNGLEALFAGKAQVVMAILSNNTPECLVTVKAKCSISSLASLNHDISGEQLAQKIKLAFDIANADPYRATTHNKGIMNGIDAVLIATGNDFRAAEAGAHTYASSSGTYRSLSQCQLQNDTFSISLTIPLAIGTVGGITNIHPLAKLSVGLLGNPSAKELMTIAAAVGLASNFAAVKSLVTTGIQKGHMKMHLSNILSSLAVDDKTKEAATLHFQNRTVSYSAVKAFVENVKGN